MIRLPSREANSLSAKFTPPLPQHSHVVRSRLADLIAAARWATLVLVRAPAGFGKTTAMAQCMADFESKGYATGWLTLDATDNDLTRFLYHAATAMTVIESSGDSPARPGDLKVGQALAELVSSVTSRFANHPQPFVLFLDDFELITESAVLRMIQVILEHLPSHGRLVVGSRNSPPLGLGRLRAHGQLMELDSEQLRFTPEEATAFFTQCQGVRLSGDDLASLYQKTEGWVAGLWLASIALERRKQQSEFVSQFSGSEQSVAEYLAEDVLAQQSPELRYFLLKTSILRSLSAPLCDALLGSSNSLEVLDRLVQDNVLLRRIDGALDCFQYHSLFASFLHSQLLRNHASEVAALHARAAAWYGAHQHLELALEHAFKGEYYALASELLEEKAIDLLAQGRSRLLNRFLAMMPEQILNDHPNLQPIRLWAVAFNQGARAAQSLIDQHHLESSPSPLIQSHLLALKPILLAMMDRGEEAWAVATQNATLLPTSCAFADTVLKNFLAEHSSVMCSRDDTGRLLDLARQAQGTSSSTFNLMYSEFAEGMVDLQEARLRQATARFRMGSLAKGNKLVHAGGYALAGVSYAAALYESNELESALHLLHVYVPLIRSLALPDHLILGHRLLARIAFSRGDIDTAFQTLSEMEYLGHEKHLPRVVASAKLERARFQLLQGHWPSAREELARADDPQVWERVAKLRLPANDVDYLTLGLLRWKIRVGQAASVFAELDREIACAEQTSRFRRAMNLYLLRAIAHWRVGQQAASLSDLSVVLQTAHVEGFMRMFLDEGESAAGLLGHYLAKRERLGSSRTPLLDDFLLRLTTVFGPLMSVHESDDSPAVVPLDEPLTRKEIQVLELLADGYSNSAMVKKLYVSDSTVRTHLRSINSKLYANSRTQAVAIARGRGLIK